jgi:cytochrome c553
MKLLLAVIPLVIAGAAFAADPSDAAAARNWQEHCARCHGPDGAGNTAMGQKLHVMDLTKAAEQAKFTDKEAFAAIMQGRVDSHGKLPEQVSDLEAHELIRFVRGLSKE